MTKALALRGGQAGVADVALWSNLAYSGFFGSLLVFAPNKFLSMYGIDAIDFLAPLTGAMQYLGGMYLMVTLRCYATLIAKVRDEKQTLEALAYMNLAILAIAAFRTVKGSGASKQVLVMRAIMTALTYCGWSAA